MAVLANFLQRLLTKGGFVAASILAVAVILSVYFLRPERGEINRILATLDQNCLGCGYDAYTKSVQPHPMAFALLASTGAKIQDRSLLRTSADWLVANAISKPNTSGWGLGFAWDAFGDKSVNPPDTVYGITTALAVGGLLDAYEATQDQTYQEAAVAALDYYSKSFTRTAAGGYFWYSDQPSDNVDVYNVSSMLMGQYARAAKLLGRSDFAELARLAARDLTAGSKHINGIEYWPYSDRHNRPNDAVHAAYVVQGMIEYARYLDSAHLLETAADYLPSFYDNDEVLEFSVLHGGTDEKSRAPARLWGVGMLIYTLSEFNRHEDAQKFVSALDRYRVEGSDVFANRPGDRGKGEPRMVAHILLGLSWLK